MMVFGNMGRREHGTSLVHVLGGEFVERGGGCKGGSASQEHRKQLSRLLLMSVGFLFSNNSTTIGDVEGLEVEISFQSKTAREELMIEPKSRCGRNLI